MWERWRWFWDEWVPRKTREEPWILAVNGDALDGVHHDSVTQVSHNLGDQARIAEACLKPIITRPECRAYFHIRGTEAHVGASAQEEERLARTLGAIPNEKGQHARYDLWLKLDHERGLLHLAHHIGTAGSLHYESTALMRELAEAITEAGRWGHQPPDVVIRSHRHRHAEVRLFGQRGFMTVCTTPAWQLKTPFTYKVAGARQAAAQIGGTLVRSGDEDTYTRHQVWPIQRSREEVVHALSKNSRTHRDRGRKRGLELVPA